MTVSSRSRGTDRRRRITVARFTAHALMFAAIWGILAGGQGWSVGMVFILLATMASCLVAPMGRWSMAGLVRFVPYFASINVRVPSPARDASPLRRVATLHRHS